MLARVTRTIYVLSTVMALSVLVSSQSPGYKPHDLAPSLRSQADAALAKKDHAAAIQLFERWLQADPRDIGSWYTLAAIHAGLGDKVKALDAFEKAVDAGLLDFERPQNDVAFDPVRREARFQAAITRIKTRRGEQYPLEFERRVAPMRSQGTYIVMLPPDYHAGNREYPLCLILQGNGSSELAHGKMADRLGREGVIYAAVRAPIYANIGATLTTGEPGFTAFPPERVQSGSRLEDTLYTDYVNWIFDVATLVEKEYRARRGKIYLWGHSQGGRFATLSAVLHPDKVGAFLSQAGSEPPARMVTDSRLQQLKRQGIPAWFVVGLSDGALGASRRAAERFKAAGIDVTLRTVPGDHSINDEMAAIGRAWVDQFVRAVR